MPVGGGGLIAGSATAAKGLRSATRVIGVEPENGDDTKRSLEAGRRISIPVPRTIADGQAADTPGELTFAVNRRLVDGIALVSDEQIRDAMRFAFERMKLVVEPSGASALAALLAHRIDRLPRRVGVILPEATSAPSVSPRFSAADSAPPAVVTVRRGLPRSRAPLLRSGTMPETVGVDAQPVMTVPVRRGRAMEGDEGHVVVEGTARVLVEVAPYVVQERLRTGMGPPREAVRQGIEAAVLRRVPR